MKTGDDALEDRSAASTFNIIISNIKTSTDNASSPDYRSNSSNRKQRDGSSFLSYASSLEKESC
jgi:hypothetical protein